MKKILLYPLAFLLAGSLVLFAGSFALSWIVSPGGDAVSVNESGLARGMELIRGKVTEIGEIYGFDPEAALEGIDEETVRMLYQQAGLWWRSIPENGMPGEEPAMDTEDLEYAIRSDDTFCARAEEQGLSEEDADTLAGEAASAVARGVLRVVLPVRQQVFERGLREVSYRADVPSLVSFLSGLPWAALALSVLLAGLIALIESRLFSRSLKYISSAMGAAAIVLILATALVHFCGLQPLLAEASESMAAQYGSIASGILLRLGAACALFLLGCAAGLFFYRRSGERA